jgi:hypothetical protein
MTARPSRATSQRAGKVRSARLTDLAALGQLSRLSHTPEDRNGDLRVRSLGLPVSTGNISVFSLFRLPLGAFQPHDQLYVYEERGRVAGLARVERETPRDEWTIVELDAVDNGEAGDIRFRLIQHLLRDGSKRGAARFHVACADEGGNVELFMQAGFARYGEERIFYRSADEPLPAPPTPAEAARQGIRAAVPLDALRLDRLYRATTPAPVSRLEAYRLHDWERQGSHWRIPRSTLTPILRFADIEAYLQEQGPAQDPVVLGFLQVGVSKEDQPHYVRVICRPEHDPGELIRFGLGIIAERTGAGRQERNGRQHSPERGVISAVRTYESPLDRRLEEQGFAALANVSLLLKETQVRVAEPALVPAASR